MEYPRKATPICDVRHLTCDPSYPSEPVDKLSPLGCTHTRIHTEDFDELGDWEHSQGIDTSRKQLSRGLGHYEADFFAFDDLFVWRYREPHHLFHEFTLPRGTIELCFAHFPDSLTWRGETFTNAAATIHCGGEAYDSVVPRGCILYGFAFSESSPVVRCMLKEETIERASRNQAAKSVRSSIIEEILRKLDRALLAGRTRPQKPVTMDWVLECCQELVDSSFTDDRSSIPPSRKHLVDDARDLMILHLSDPLTAADISQELGVTRRTLERAFQTQLGVTPYQFLLTERLHAARSLLRAGDQSVHDCCKQSGFEDASRFSSMYARHFGELPSQTKGRNQARIRAHLRRDKPR